MNKLQMLRIIGESYARTCLSDTVIKARFADRFFEELATEMYPENEHRREWALSNLRLFYNSESGRIIIMDKLSNQDGIDDATLKELMARR